MEQPFWVQCFAQGYIDMQTGGTEDRTTDIPIVNTLFLPNHGPESFVNLVM